MSSQLAESHPHHRRRDRRAGSLGIIVKGVGFGLGRQHHRGHRWRLHRHLGCSVRSASWIGGDHRHPSSTRRSAPQSCLFIISSRETGVTARFRRVNCLTNHGRAPARPGRQSMLRCSKRWAKMAWSGTRCATNLTRRQTLDFPHLCPATQRLRIATRFTARTWPRGRPAYRSPSICRPRPATTLTTCSPRRSRQGQACRSAISATCARCSTAFRSTR